MAFVRKLEEEEALRAMPLPEVEEISDSGLIAMGCSFFRQFRRLAPGAYDEYSKKLTGLGWKAHVFHAEPLHDVVFSSVWVKDDLSLSVVFYLWNREKNANLMCVTVSPIDENFFADPEDAFAGLPALGAEAVDFGDGHYVKTVKNVGKDLYTAYLAALGRSGFEKAAENSIDSSVFNALFVKGEKSVSVTYASGRRSLYVCAANGDPVSPHLKKCDSGAIPGAKTSLHMLEMWWFGNSFAVKLKNSHFILSDGGMGCEVPYLIDYLESMTSPGTKPVVEGWFFSHGHPDHNGVLIELSKRPDLAQRIIVDGIYFSQPSVEVMTLDNGSEGEMALARRASETLVGSDGKPTPFYRPHTGERYYFSDVTVDVIMSQEQLPYEEYSGDLNDSSTWLMLTSEGQKTLLGGDGDKGGMAFITDNYSREYMTVDVMSLLHHGHNVRNPFTDFMTVKTVLCTTFGDGPEYRRDRIDYLKSKIEEYLPWRNGTVVINYPYKVGEYETRPHFDWSKHNPGQKRPALPNSGEDRG